MGEIYENKKHSGEKIALGNNDYKTGSLTVDASCELKAGTVVCLSGGKYVKATGAESEAGLAVLVDTFTNGTNKGVDVSARVLISGRVNKNALLIGSSPATETQSDNLRKWGIIAIPVVDVGQFDNE